MPLWSFLTILLVVACLLRDGRAAGAACVLLVNWAVCKQLADASGDQFNWAWLALIDFVSAAVLTGPATVRAIFGAAPALSLIGGAITVGYAMALAAHSAFGLSDRGPWPQYSYWWTTHYLAWGQAWCLALWEAWRGGRKARDHRSDRLRRSGAAGVGVAGVARSSEATFR